MLVACLMVIVMGCSAKPVDSSLVGSCKISLIAQGIWASYDNVYAGDFILSGGDAPILTDESKSYGEVAVGTKFRIVELLKGSNGSFGSFLRVRAKIVSGPYEGLVVDVPACVPYHPRPRWVLGCTLNSELLRFDSAVVADCE